MNLSRPLRVLFQGSPTSRKSTARPHLDLVRLAAALTAFGAVLFAQIPVAALDPLAPLQTPPHIDETAAASIDYAAATGVSPADATERVKVLADARPILDQIRDGDDGTLAGIFIDHHPELTINLRFVGTPSDKVGDLVASLPGNVALNTDAKVSLRESEERVDKAINALLARIPSLVGAGIDERTGELVLDVEFTAADGDRNESDTAAQRVQHVRRDADAILDFDEIPVRVQLLAGEVSDGHTYGGTRLTACSGGFVVKHGYSGTPGLSTAGHCNRNQTYTGFGTDGTYALSFQQETRSGRADIQWHTDGHSKAPEFYANLTTARRKVLSQTFRGSVSNGDTVCHRGRATGYSCGIVQNRSYRPTYNGACPSTCSNTWIQVSGPNLECFPGDSGGPWFFSHSAFGIYKGQASNGTTAADCDFAIFMSVSYFGDVGVQVWVSS